MITAATLGEVIEARREHLDLPRKDTVARLGISNSYYTQLIKGDRWPSLTTLIDLATALDTTPAHLLAWADTDTQRKRARLV